MIKITKERFDELGLGVYKDACVNCDDCVIENNKMYCNLDKSKTIEEFEKELEVAPCVDEHRIKLEMSEAEYWAYQHNGLNVE